MTLITPKEKISNQPQTHVLIISVGRYIHLNGGSSPSPLDNPMGMGQLYSPPVSGRDFANWIENEYNNPASPVGSIEFLISDHNYHKYKTKNEEEKNIEKATLNNVEKAFMRWYERCNSNPNNIAIFYFCGHGIEKNNLALLLEDFGEDYDKNKKLFKNSINFQANRLGMFTHCQAQTQLYFIDACRKTGDNKIKRTNDDLATTFIPGEIGRVCENTLTIMASESGQAAYGRIGKTTLFTRSLIESLDKWGCDFYEEQELYDRIDRTNLEENYKEGAWVIDTQYLFYSVKATLERLIKEDLWMQNDPEVLRQRCDRDMPPKGSVLIHLRTTPIEIPISIAVKPYQARKRVKLTLENTNPEYSREHEPSPQIWKTNICAELYTLKGNFELQEYQDFFKQYDFRSKLYKQPKDKKVTARRMEAN